MEFLKKIYHLYLNVFIKLIKQELVEKVELDLGLAIAKNIIDSHGGVITASRRRKRNGNGSYIAFEISCN